eukprot:TRINITY_DN36_c2_g1_i1.p1 TRINITY_DN36_c2_g1~~TRINITY_DN36_c2_g1_i1.p1  ORF type:complete len:631 (-),score=204.06 TRINITY_DN36_c2_g1_i1:19-1725(-)
MAACAGAVSRWSGLRHSQASSLLRFSTLTTARSMATAPDFFYMPVTVRNPQNAAAVAHAIGDVVEQYCYLRGDPVRTATEAAALEPDCALAHCAVGLLSCVGQAVPLSDAAIAGRLREARRIGSAGLASERDAAFTQALEHWAKGQWRSGVGALERWLAHNPKDLFALRLSQDGYLFMGDTVNLRDVVARVFPAWSNGDYGYGAVLAMYAFGLVENDNYDGALEAAHRSLGLYKQDVWALHAATHVYEAMGRANEGQSMLRDKARDWEDANLYSTHMAWHLALFYLDQANYRPALRVYDTDVARCKAGDPWPEEALALLAPFPLTDMTSLLWRLELAGGDAEDRWMEVAKAWTRFDTLHVSAFSDVHACMAYAAMAARPDGEPWAERGRALVARMRSTAEAQRDAAATADDDSAQGAAAAAAAAAAAMPFSAHHPGRGAQGAAEPDNAWVALHVGIPLCEGMLAYGSGDFEAACAHLLSVRHHASAIGGSNAQRDVVPLTLMEAALRLEDQSLARALVSERITNKPNSAQGWIRYGAVMERLGDEAGARSAAHTAYQLGLGQRGRGSN